MKTISSYPNPGGWKNGPNCAYLFGDCACARALFDQIKRQTSPEFYFDVIFRYHNLVVAGTLTLSRKAFFTLPNGVRILIERGKPGDKLCFVRECTFTDTSMFCMDKSCHLLTENKSAY
jgi:hypothetical protein